MHVSLKSLLPALSIALFTAMPAFSSTIALGMTGVASVGDDFISFGSSPYTGPYVAAPGYGKFTVTTPVTDIFATNGVTPGETGNIQSLQAQIEPAGVVFPTPINFITFDGGGSNLDLYMTELLVGNTGQSPASPFFFSETSTGATAAIDFVGYILNTTDNTKTDYSGIFQATFSGETVAELEASLPVSTAFSGTLSLTATPEPASMLLMGIGLVGAGIVARKKKIARG